MKTYLVCQFETSRIQLLNHFQIHLFQQFDSLPILTLHLPQLHPLVEALHGPPISDIRELRSLICGQ